MKRKCSNIQLWFSFVAWEREREREKLVWFTYFPIRKSRQVEKLLVETGELCRSLNISTDATKFNVHTLYALNVFISFLRSNFVLSVCFKRNRKKKTQRKLISTEKHFLLHVRVNHLFPWGTSVVVFSCWSLKCKRKKSVKSHKSSEKENTTKAFEWFNCAHSRYTAIFKHKTAEHFN